MRNIFKMDKIKIHLSLLILYLVLISFFVIIFKTPYYFSIFLYFLVPAISFIFVDKKNAVKVLIFSILYGITVSLFADYFGITWGYWEVPNTIFPVRVLSVIPIEDFLWGITGTFVSIMLYKTYFNKKNYKSSNLKLLFFLCANVILVAVFFIIKDFNIRVPYFFAIGSFLLFLPPIILYGIFKTKEILTILPTLFIYLFVVGFELSSLYNQHWIFNLDSQVLAWINFFGLQFPLEEFLAFFILGPIANIVYFKYFFE